MLPKHIFAERPAKQTRISFLSFTFSFLSDNVCFIFSGAGKFCLAYGLRQLTRDVKSDVRTLNFRSDVTNAPPRKNLNDVRRSSLCNVKCKKIRIINKKFNVIGKKNNQTSVSDAVREIPTLRATHNAGNSVNLVSSILRLPSGLGLGFFCLHQKPMIVSI